MKSLCRPVHHLSRRALLKGTLLTAGGLVLPNWGSLFNSQTVAGEAAKRGKRCILLWMAGGASQIDTFDMKPGRLHGGPFRPVATNVPGIQICEYLPNVARHADKLAIVRTLYTPEGSHPGATYVMHTGFRPEAQVIHPELGSMCAKYLGDPGADLPSCIHINLHGGSSSPNFGAGFLGPAYHPFRVASGGGLPENTTPYVSPAADERRNQLLRSFEEDFGRGRQAAELEAQRNAQEKA